MYRFIEKKLVNWKDKQHRKPLIVRGVRQVGKTYSIMDFGNKYFPGMVHRIDLEKRPDLHPIFEPNLDVKRIVADLELVLNIHIEAGKDLLFFDEIQSCPRALMSLRYFYEDMPDLHVIAAGSLLEFALKDISFPVGRIEFLEMFPMTFEEFLIAQSKDQAVELLNNPAQSISQPVHRYLLEELRKYFFIGGMPESIKTFVESGSFQKAFEVQTGLIETFREDFSKYAPYANKQCLNTVLLSVARNVGKRVVYSRFAEGFTGPTIKKAFNLLTKARLVYSIPSTSPAGIPLGASASARKFKVLFVDIGLMQNLCGVRTGEEFYKKNLLDIYNGALAEQFVGQEIMAYSDSQLFFWSREAKSSTAEVDYLIEKDGIVYPIEVKSGPAGKLKSLHLLLKTYTNIPYGYVFSSAPFGDLPEQRLKFIPLYAVKQIFNSYP